MFFVSLFVWVFFNFGLITEKNEGIFTKINIQMLFVSIIIDVKHYQIKVSFALA